MSDEPIDVIAPSDLPGGYELHINVGNDPMIVTVPMDGVIEGEVFSAVPRPAVSTTVTPLIPGIGGVPITGNFRNALCDCWYFDQAFFWCATFCYPCALAQIMTRMGLDWKGDPKQDPTSGRSAFCVVLAILIVGYILMFVTAAVKDIKENKKEESSDYDIVEEEATEFDPFGSPIYCILTFYILHIMIQTRAYIRNKYLIEGSYYGDCCASFWCPWCAVSQMASHTADPTIMKSKCCTETGLDAGVTIV